MEKLGHGGDWLDKGIKHDCPQNRVNKAAIAHSWPMLCYLLCYLGLTASACIGTETSRADGSAPEAIGRFAAKMEGSANMSHSATHDVAARPEAAIVAALGRRSVVLVGMMGAGKSSIGRRVALRMGVPFVDADAEIEKAAGMTVPDIFSVRGEAEFRSGEARVIVRLLEGGPQVLSTGGGAFMNCDTRAVIASKGISIWLKAEFDVLMKRIRRRHDRPLLKTDDPAGTLRTLMQERYPTYALADLTVESRDVPHDRIVDEIVSALAAHLGAAQSLVNVS